MPDVDYGVEGSFYLRGSVGANYLWAREVTYDDPCLCAAVVSPVTTAGYGYSFGAGFGYETGTGLRTDLTVDYLNNTGLTRRHVHADAALDHRDGQRLLRLPALRGRLRRVRCLCRCRCRCRLQPDLSHRRPGAGPDGANWAAAGALMAGVTYDMGSMVADLGYRLVYMPQITNGSAAMLPVGSPYYINENMIHEVRGTLRYRFN